MGHIFYLTYIFGKIVNLFMISILEPVIQDQDPTKKVRIRDTVDYSHGHCTYTVYTVYTSYTVYSTWWEGSQGDRSPGATD